MGSPMRVAGDAARKLRRDDSGSAIVEFIFAATVLLIPMIYLILAASQLQAGSYAVVGAADQAAKVFAAADTPAQAQADAREAANRAMNNFGYSSARTSISCDSTCLSPGSVVTVRVELDVPLPLVSDFLDASVFSVDSSASQRVDRFG
ncbi:TadE/TadG family type IV pilus assembly protein [Glutamicibacter sp. JC586]|uniref:TadE/TadG family type IV pilus assembly protein n=1 Tax=Glutamicibacter sp. JC586 TaxID=2590552 RepID=UPI0013575D29|nr:hypothetical protein [Glutamicibacter sp. JC586]